MKLYFLKILVVLGGISTSSCGDIGDQPYSGTHEQSAGQKPPGAGTTFRVPRYLNDTDSAFMHTAKTAGLLEIAAGKVALQKTTEPHVKDFAFLMVKEHTGLKASVYPIR
jgi:predicted outer membrane protein